MSKHCKELMPRPVGEFCSRYGSPRQDCCAKLLVVSCAVLGSLVAFPISNIGLALRRNLGSESASLGIEHCFCPFSVKFSWPSTHKLRYIQKS
ncbi:hypothetical protein K461DRAFT_113694 [Myriangium duriaei CBS 260.36]|uniref:Uncharacterized protein n=1 Tax=Myriangium duriaei CBS 260.36 TaxID=1168546 RepID=A0A9P4MMR1_9PEZI|nr:hypothetical protein K461DRAFT_113694 [Myriangium duriaei CBS 260.36]